MSLIWNVIVFQHQQKSIKCITCITCITGMGKELENLILENTELLETK